MLIENKWYRDVACPDEATFFKAAGLNIDDWGKLRETIEIVSADPKDLRRMIVDEFGHREVYQCHECRKFSDDAEFDGDYYYCTSCHAAHNPPPAEKE